MSVPPPHPDRVLETLRDPFGHPGFRPGQEPLVRAVLDGRDALGVLPTGGGKSVCYMLPALLLPATTLVVSPLLSLMRDQLRRAREIGLAAEVVDSTQDAATRSEILGRAREGAVGLLLLSPERLASASFRDALREVPVSLLAVDEAHCISAWGHDFRPEYLRIGEVRGSLPAPRPPVLALTATATPRVRAEIRSSLRLRDPLEIVGDFDRPNLSLHVVRAGRHPRKMALLGGLLREREGAVVVYAATRRAVEAVRRGLARRGLPVEAYHAGLPAEERARVQEVFLSHPRPVVVATNAFGMGIDRADVRRVVHYQLPGSLEAYYQEAGRAGRDGAPASCVALTGPGDEAVHRRFLDRSHPPVSALRALRRLLEREAGAERTLPVDPGRFREAVARPARPRLRIPGRPPPPDPDEIPHLLRALVRSGGVWADPPARETLEAWAESPEAFAEAPCPGSEPPDPDRRILPGPRGFPGKIGLPRRWAPDRARRLRRGGRERLRAIRSFARGWGCRKARLLGYFGQDAPAGRCGACDRCGTGREATVQTSSGNGSDAPIPRRRPPPPPRRGP